MKGIVDGLMISIKAVALFQFKFADKKGEGPWRLVRAIGEFLDQTGLMVVENAEDSNGNICVSIKRSEWAKEEEQFPMFRIPGTEFIGITSDYTTVFLRGDGVCIIDRIQQMENPGYGEGGYFATQDGTAIGRVLGQGFTPTDHDNRNMWLYWPDEPAQALPDLDLSDNPWGGVQWIDEILICSDGHIEIPIPNDEGKVVYHIVTTFVQ